MSDNFGKDVFKLGFGLMRLPKNPDGSIDVDHTARMVDAFLAAGGTYFDTAFVYDNGGSEAAIRKALVERHPRESYTLCTKLNAWFPGMDEQSSKQQFFTSLERTGVGYFDYYLLHAINDDNISRYNDYGIWDFVAEQKAKGLVKAYGFSYHGTPEFLDRLLKAHPEVDFIQLQINYADWENPDVKSRACWETARKHGKPVTVMEPVKGGILANPPERVKKILREADPEASCASWAVRYAASLDGILTVLSGMSNMAQMEDNLSYMKDFHPLTEEEQEVILRARAALAEVETIPCTSCHYCTDGCPMEIPIPEIFAARNMQLLFEQDRPARDSYAREINGKGRASDCVRCCQCENACPQHLPITELLEQCVANLE